MNFLGAEIDALYDLTHRFERHLDTLWWPLMDEVDHKIASIFWVGPDSDRTRHAVEAILQQPVYDFLMHAREAAITLRWGYAAQREASGL